MREQAALEARLSHQATHDELTGLPSRSLIITHIDQMLASSTRTDKPVSVMFIDLDQFKLVNDSMGHSMGDQLLVQASRRIASCLRPGDVVGRISGDEFIVVVGLDAMGAFSFGERIRRSLSDSFFLDSGEVFISVSIGVTVRIAQRRHPGCDADPRGRHGDVPLEGQRQKSCHHLRFVDASNEWLDASSWNVGFATH